MSQSRIGGAFSGIETISLTDLFDVTITNPLNHDIIVYNASTSQWVNVTIASVIPPTNPGGADTNVQFNDGGIFGGSPYFRFNKTSGLVTIDPPIKTVATPTNLVITIEEDPSYGYPDPRGSTITINAQIYAYDFDSFGNRVYSPTALTTTDLVANPGGIYRVNIAWDASLGGAAGYLVLYSNDSLGFVYDYYVDVPTNSLIDNNDQTWITPIIATTPIASSGKALRANGYVSINTDPVELLTVGGNILGYGTLKVTADDIPDGTSIYGKSFIRTITDGFRSVVVGNYDEINWDVPGGSGSDVYGSWQKITITDTTVGVPSTLYGSRIDVVYNNGSSSLAGQFVNVIIGATSSPTSAYGAQYSVAKTANQNTGSVLGLRLIGILSGIGTVTTFRGADMRAVTSISNNGATVSVMDGGYFLSQIIDRGTYTNVSGGHFEMILSTSGTAAVITNAYGILVDWAATGVTLTNGYGIKIPDITGATNNFSIFTGTGKIRLGDKITTYNAIATTGWGVPSIYGTGRSTAQTAAVTSVATYTVGASDGSFVVSANVNVTTSTAHSFTVAVAYTDETNTARTLTLSFSQLAGTIINTITNVTGAGPYEGVPVQIRCKASTAITISTAGTFTTVTYNVEGSIAQIS